MQDISNLENLSMDELKSLWKVYFGRECPKFTSRVTLVGRIAYRMQEIQSGGLKQSTIDTLIEYATGERNPPKEQAYKPMVGTVLVREHNGIMHRATVLYKGYEYNGDTYKSLSAVAKAITGTNWNGNVFFGLRKRA